MTDTTQPRILHDRDGVRFVELSESYDTSHGGLGLTRRTVIFSDGYVHIQSFDSVSQSSSSVQLSLEDMGRLIDAFRQFGLDRQYAMMEFLRAEDEARYHSQPSLSCVYTVEADNPEYPVLYVESGLPVVYSYTGPFENAVDAMQAFLAHGPYDRCTYMDYAVFELQYMTFEDGRLDKPADVPQLAVVKSM